MQTEQTGHTYSHIDGCRTCGTCGALVADWPKNAAGEYDPTNVPNWDKHVAWHQSIGR